jgi:hypothetical protein
MAAEPEMSDVKLICSAVAMVKWKALSVPLMANPSAAEVLSGNAVGCSQ